MTDPTRIPPVPAGQESTAIPAWVDGVLTPVDKLQAHLQGLRHKAVSVFVVRGTEILLQRRAMGKYHTPGLWANTCCTHPHWNEPSDVCAIRRLKQELGITGLFPEFRHHLEYRADVGKGMVEFEAVDVFLARTFGDLAIDPDPDEVMEIRWTDYHDLLAEIGRHPERFTPWLKIYLKNHADTIFGPDLRLSSKS
ncbi:isopentenyl-diphosphate delta-isomerase [Seohaeicola saemankumensis]|nr:isopentenyl-diphosphate delta-isomerase [Seohaeicola saemankumensis]MCA0872537.1 isopentenyl-diphosphate delta-isomerase [Seohaeicola saemankumensis]